jgi:hypothetical protein
MIENGARKKKQGEKKATTIGYPTPMGMECGGNKF